MFWSVIFILGVICTILRIIHNFKEPVQVQPSQGNQFNNVFHNPALIDNLETFVIFVLVALTTIPGLFFIKDGPNEFVLANLPNQILALIMVPGLFYCFNKNLRGYVRRETKEWLGIGQTPVQVIELSVISK